MFDEIDPRSPTPIYEQIASRIRMAVASEEVEPGDSLPSVRRLASRLRVNPATVAQAYRDLEAEGFVSKKRGSGTFVDDVPGARKADERRSRASELVQELLSDAARLGVDVDDLVAALRQQLGEKLDE